MCLSVHPTSVNAIEELLFCEPLLEATKATDVLQMVKSFLPNKTLVERKTFIVYLQMEHLQSSGKRQDLLV